MAGLDQRFYELFDCVADLRGRGKADLFLEAAIDRYGLCHIAYAGINFKSPNRGFYYLKSTYSDEWINRYLSKNYVMIDPVVRNGLTSLIPFDWSELPRRNRIIHDFFAESVEFGLGQQGLSVPLRGAGNEIALFNLNTDMSEKEWRSTRSLLVRDFQILAVLFHDGVLDSQDSGRPATAGRLSPRETECLKWAAEGKTAWETSLILGISERCVRFHLDHARRKLNCLTKVQTVAKAIASGLVTLS